MDTEINNFIKQNSKKKSKKRTTKRTTKSKLVEGNINKNEVGNIHFDDRFEPLKFKDNILLFPDGKISSAIINSKQIEKYVVSVSNNGGVYITLQPKKMATTYEEYKKVKESNKI